jgi:hypothetical protein
MPQYDFLCQSCKRLFSNTLTLPEYEQAVIKCQFCGTDDVAQGRWIAFHSVPATKSTSAPACRPRAPNNLPRGFCRRNGESTVRSDLTDLPSS